MYNTTASVLVVDHSRVMRLNLRLLTQKFLGPCRVREASNLAEAMDLLKHWTPDFATVDLNLKGDSGMDLVQELLKKLPASRISLITANQMFGIQKQCDSLGVTYLSKSDYMEDKEGFTDQFEDFLKMRSVKFTHY